MRCSWPLLIALVLAVALLHCAHATQYTIFSRAPLTLTQNFALQQVSTLVSSGATTSLWATPDDGNLTHIADVVGSAFPGVLRRRSPSALTSSTLIVDTVKPVAKTATASWGIDRVDERTLPLSNSYTPDRSGVGVAIWVVDTGIDASHADFGGRASNVFSAYSPPTDCDGHGTHVSGTAGGATFGIARQATLLGVKVLDCGGSGTTLTVAQGLQYVLDNKQPSKNVINMSFGYGIRDYVIAALLQDLYDAGVTMAAAAGNSNTNACAHYPSAEPTVISVAASTTVDARASFSNYGSCVALFAPGQSIVSALLGGGSTTMSGTSMASPHVAGAAALALQNGQLAPSVVRANLLNRATQNVMSSVSGSPNRLLFTLQDSNPAQPPAPTTSSSSSSSTSSSSSSSSSTTGNSSARASGAALALVLSTAVMIVLFQ
jgi:subtilisin family serine protease